MALIISAATGNFNAGATWVGGVVPTIGDEAQAANGHTVTITANATCDLISNTGTGIFTLNDGVTLTANVTNKSTTTSRSCLQFTAALPAVGYIVGNCTGGFVNTAVAASNSGSGTLRITGNCLGGSAVGAAAASNSGSGTLSITGNVTGGTANTASGAINVAGLLNITGNVTGGSTSAASLANANAGVFNQSTTGSITITGNVTGGAGSSSIGAFNNSTGIITINGVATAGTVNGTPGAHNASTGVINLIRAKGNAYGPGSTAGLQPGNGAVNAGLGVIEIQELEYGTFGQSPTSGTGIRLKKLGSNVAVFNYCDTAGAKTLIDATANAAMPAATNVRSGVSYASGALTGTCAVPAAGSVSLGVPVDAGFGTAVLTPEAVWGHANRTITGGLVDTATTLTNAPTVPSVVQIRQEMDANSVKLANLDATVSSRLAPSGTLATVTTLTNAPTVPSAADIATQVRSELSVELGRVDSAVSSRLASADYTTPPTTSAIATAVEGSLLNEGDGQAVLNAIVAAIGNQNLSEVSLVAAVRADLERSGGKLDSIPTTAAPTAAQNATAVWGASAKVITGGVVDTLTNAPASVTPSDIWSHAARTLTSASGPTATEIRQEMDSNSTKLSAIKSKTDNLPSDPADQSLLEAAIAGVTVPSAGQVASQVRTELSSELAKVAALNTERLANVATTAIVGNLLAQANS